MTKQKTKEAVDELEVEISEKEEPKGFNFEDYNLENLEAGAEKWNFNEGKQFIGKYVSEMIPDDGDYAGELLGYNFESVDDGKMWIVPNTYIIEKSLKSPSTKQEDNGIMIMDVKGVLFVFTFLGKGENSKGQDFNKFRVDVLRPKPKE